MVPRFKAKNESLRRKNAQNKDCPETKSETAEIGIL